MLNDTEKRALLRFVTRHQTDPTVNLSGFAAALEAYNGEDVAFFLHSLVHHKILSLTIAKRLHQDMSQFSGQTPNGTSQPQNIAPTKAPGRNGHVAKSTENTSGTHFGEYRILRKIGEGGICRVYLAYREADQRNIAIKILPNDAAEDQETLDRFYREAKNSTMLNHPNIVRSMTFGQDHATGVHFLVMEFVNGPTAHKLLDRYGRLSVGDAVRIVLDIAHGLEYAHSRNVIHRDIKPENILLTKTGIAKLGDMGLAKRTDEASHLTGTHQGFGTPFYMPYEQAVNARHADGRSDIYALGATLYHLVTGELPFIAESHLEIIEKKCIGEFRSARAINPFVTPQLDAIINKMMAANPKDRYQTVHELRVDLEHTKLAPTVPSFVDESLAFQDPHLRERFSNATQPTQPDLRLHGRHMRESAAETVWFVRYVDAKGALCKVKISTADLAEQLRRRRIPPTAEVAHSVHAEFRPVAEFTEFQSVLTRLHNSNGHAAKTHRKLDGSGETSPKNSLSWWPVLIGGTAVTAILIATAFMLWKLL